MPLKPLPAVDPVEAGRFRRQVKLLLLSALVGSDAVADVPAHERDVQGTPHALACAVADLIDVLIVALSEGAKPADERVASDVGWDEECIRDVLTDGLDVITGNIHRTLTGEDEWAKQH